MPNYQPNLRDSLLKGPADLDVVVASSKVRYFGGKARGVSSRSKVGPFDVLPLHENFISLIYEKVVVVDERGQDHNFACRHGILAVCENKVRVFIGI